MIHQAGNIKLSGNGKTFKTRYVVVQNNLMLTFEKAPSYGACKPVKMRDLTNAKVKGASSGLKEGLIAVELEMGKPVYLRTYDPDEAKSWTSSLKRAVKAPKTRDTNSAAKKKKAQQKVNIYDPGRAPSKSERKETKLKEELTKLEQDRAELEEEKARLKEERRKARKERKAAKQQAENDRMKTAAAAASAMSYAPPGGGDMYAAPVGTYAPPGGAYAPPMGGHPGGGGMYNPTAGAPPTFTPGMTYGTPSFTGSSGGGTFNPYGMPSVPTVDPNIPGHTPTFNPAQQPHYYG